MARSSPSLEPPTRRGRETRDRIVAAAAALIYDRGEAEVGIRDVKEAAGVSGSQMTHYFPDRDSLVRAVVAYRSAEVRGHLSEPEIDSLAGLRHWARLTIERLRGRGPEGGCFLGSLVAQLSERDEVARAEIAAGFDGWIEDLAAALRRIQEAGEIGPEADPDELATGLMAALQGGYMLAQATRDIAPMETAVFSMIDHIESFRRGRGPRAKKMA
ncbi:MAG TPA: TetR/AcrR family transcriptional regulator [Solirubrobacterales bacterium]|jgi:AcrR family transcriptional regulator